ncbi:MAG TPA: hypothetical protein VFC82_01790 [Actinomycetaceae bacterium]|nr:hypothetical protein [Actinomycetaceae bacterium]
MESHLYVSTVPEALIVSQLPPEQFGQYYATGYARLSKGQVVFLELDPTFRHDYFPLDEALARTIPHPDGRPKNSTYVSTYRVIEHVPVSAIRRLYLSTEYGATIPLDRGDTLPDDGGGLHLYQELAPVRSLVAASLPPRAFYDSITASTTTLVNFPALCFVELTIGELAADPERGAVGDLPYDNMSHLRECLVEVQEPGKGTKMVERQSNMSHPYRTVKTGSGFYYGNGEDLAFFPMPEHDWLRTHHTQWWNQANR